MSQLESTQYSLEDINLFIQKANELLANKEHNPSEFVNLVIAIGKNPKEYFNEKELS